MRITLGEFLACSKHSISSRYLFLNDNGRDNDVQGGYSTCCKSQIAPFQKDFTLLSLSLKLARDQAVPEKACAKVRQPAYPASANKVISMYQSESCNGYQGWHLVVIVRNLSGWKVWFPGWPFPRTPFCPKK